MKYSSIILGMMILLLVAMPALAATNSYTALKTTTSELSTGAWNNGFTISSDKLALSSGVGEYISPPFIANNLTSADVNYASFDTSVDTLDYAFLYSNTQWLNSTDARHVGGGSAYHSIRYPFTSSSGGVTPDVWFADNSASHTDLTLYNGAAITAVASHPYQNYLALDGANDYARTSYTYDYTAGTWYIAGMINAQSSGNTLFAVSDSGTNAYIMVEYIDATSDYLRIHLVDQNGHDYTYSDTGKTITPGSWHYVALRADSTKLYLYCDGVLHTSGNIKYDSNSNFNLDYLSLGAVYYGGTTPTSFFGGWVDEFRFHAGSTSASDFLSNGLMGTYMWNCVQGTSPTKQASYKVSGAGNGNLFAVVQGTGTFDVTDLSMTMLNTKPTYGTVYPNGIDYPSESVTLRVAVHDVDVSYTSNISGLFYVDGVSKGTATRTTDGNLEKNVGALTGGTHNWSALVYDPWSGSVSTSIYSFNVPADLDIRDEEHPDDLITDAEVRVSFYTESMSITKMSSNGTIFLYGLPTSDMLVSASAEGYIPRKTIVFSLYETNTIYLLNESADVIYQKFVLNTQTITGSPTEYILKIQKPMNGTVNTVFSSYFDFDGGCGTYLIESDVYRLVIVAPDGTESEYGYLYPDPDGQVDIAYQGITFNEYVNAWLSTNTTIDRDVMSIAYAYEEAAQDNSLNPISVTEATMRITDADGNTVYNVTVTENSYVFQYSAAADGRYTVDIEILGEDEDGNEFSYTKSFVVDFIDDHFQFMPNAYPDWLKMLIVTFLCLFVLIAFGGYRSDLAAGLSFGLYAFSAYQEWISVGSLALGVMFIIVMAAFFKLQRNIKRTG